MLVSAATKNGRARQLVNKAIDDKQYDLVISPEIISETENVLSRPKFEMHPDALGIFQLVTTSAEIVATESEFRGVRADPDDDIVINAAHDGRADYIVTGDRHLLGMGEFRGIPIITIARMLDLLQS